jgi:hypothetical protein
MACALRWLVPVDRSGVDAAAAAAVVVYGECGLRRQ